MLEDNNNVLITEYRIEWNSCRLQRSQIVAVTRNTLIEKLRMVIDKCTKTTTYISAKLSVLSLFLIIRKPDICFKLFW